MYGANLFWMLQFMMPLLEGKLILTKSRNNQLSGNVNILSHNVCSNFEGTILSICYQWSMSKLSILEQLFTLTLGVFHYYLNINIVKQGHVTFIHEEI